MLVCRPAPRAPRHPIALPRGAGLLALAALLGLWSGVPAPASAGAPDGVGPSIAAVRPARSSGQSHVHVSPDGQVSAACTCRPATAAELADPALAPDGWVQDGPRESYRLDGVPLPTAPDWVGTRVRATGALVWGDADGDGDDDLFVGTYYGQMYPPIIDYFNFIYLNDGGMLESEPSWISVDERHTTDADWGLIDGDTVPDLFVANGGQSLQANQVFFGQAAGILPVSAGWVSNDNCWAIGCALADFDQDGDVDVATANQGNTANPFRPTYIFRNTGNGLESSPSWASAQIGITNDVDWGDMDGDGWLDLAVSGWVNWQTGVFRNLGTTLETGFAWTTGQPSDSDKGIGWALVDGDARPDLAVGGNSDPDRLFLNEGGMLGATPVWSSGESYHGCQDLAWVDIDHDGDDDLATINFGNGHARIYLNDGGTLSTLADWQYDAASSGTALAFGDVNGDGWLDLAIGVANGPIELFLNTGAPAAVRNEMRVAPARQRLGVVLAPNPLRPGGRLLVEGDRAFRIEQVMLADVAGRRWSIGAADDALSGDGGLAGRHALALSAAGGVAGRLPAGVYFLEVRGRDDAGRPLTGTGRVVLLDR
ncbi:MAG: VCBS repeat-containing protein [Candidatus Eiseniibacteriota bacterium]